MSVLQQTFLAFGLLTVLCMACCWMAVHRTPPDPVAVEPHPEACGASHKVSSAVCTLPPHGSERRHLDERQHVAFGPAHLPTHSTEGDHR